MCIYRNKKTGEPYNDNYIVVNGTTIICPKEETLLEHGYERVEVPENKLQQAIEAKVAEIKAYDQSDAVNSFRLNGMPVWINREDRIGTRRAIELDAEAGKTESDIWLHGFHLRVNCQLAMKLLDMVGSYAYEAYNVTQQHLYAVQQLKTAENVRKYDHTQGYPEKLDLKTE